MSNGCGAGLRVGIVGGSIAGCALAVELSRVGCDVTILERTQNELKDRGAGIGSVPSVLRSLVERDLIDADLPYFEIKERPFIWRSGEDNRFGSVRWVQPLNLIAFNWGSLFQSLRKRVPDGRYLTEHAVGAVRDHGDSVTVTLTDKRELEYDLVVFADGYRSFGRQTLFPDASIRYAGYVLWRGVLDEIHLDEVGPLEGTLATPGYRDGHGVFYFVPNPVGDTAPGKRWLNWAVYVKVNAASRAAFLTDRDGVSRFGSIPPGSIPGSTSEQLMELARRVLPGYYADVVSASSDTFVQAIFDANVPAYRRGRVCLAGDAGALARPHSGSGAMKGIQNAIGLADQLQAHDRLDDALLAWNVEQTRAGNDVVRFGNQIGRALVDEVSDWSSMSPREMAGWWDSIVTIRHELLADA